MKNLIVIGLILSAFILSDGLFAADINEEWAVRYDGVANSFDYARDIAVDDSGNVYITGESWGGDTDYDYATVKYDANGNELWVRRYNGPGDSWDYAYDIALDKSGNIYVTGSSYVYGASMDYTTIKYDSDGSELWVARYNSPANAHDTARAIAVDNSGNVYVTGESWGVGTNYDYATLKYDSVGNELWVARYNGPANSHDVAYAMTLDNSGNVYVTGYSYGSAASLDYGTIKYDTNGSEIWTMYYDGPANWSDVGQAIAVDSSNNVYVTGYSWNDATTYDYATIKYSQHNTPVGNNVVVYDPQTGTTITFDTVEQAGDTTVTLTDIGQDTPPPSGLELLPPNIYYEINTTAVYSGMIHIAIQYDDTELTNGGEQTLKLRHYEEATEEWVNITTRLDMANNTLYAETGHLALFAVTMGVVTTVDIDPDTINLKSKGNYITCYIELYEGYSAADIDLTQRLTISRGEDSVLSEPKPIVVGDVDEDGIEDLTVKFSRPAVHQMLVPGYLQLSVGGMLILDEQGDSVNFEGLGTVYVKDKGKDHINESDAASVQY